LGGSCGCPAFRSPRRCRRSRARCSRCCHLGKDERSRWWVYGLGSCRQRKLRGRRSLPYRGSTSATVLLLVQGWQRRWPFNGLLCRSVAVSIVAWLRRRCGEGGAEERQARRRGDKEGLHNHSGGGTGVEAWGHKASTKAKPPKRGGWVDLLFSHTQMAGIDACQVYRTSGGPFP